MKTREIWWTQSRKLCHKWICPATWVFGKKCDTSSLFQAPANRAKECAANWDITRLLPTLQRAWSHSHPTAYFSGLVTTLCTWCFLLECIMLHHQQPPSAWFWLFWPMSHCRQHRTFFILTKMMVVLKIHLLENFTERDKHFAWGFFKIRMAVFFSFQLCLF